MIILIFASNQFEGSKFSHIETNRILADWIGRSTQDIMKALEPEPFDLSMSKRQRPPSRREVLQHYLAFREIMAGLENPLTEEKIKSVNKTLMTGLLDDDGLAIDEGNYRTENISARGFLFRDPKFVAKDMADLVNKFNEEVNNPEVDSCLLAGWLMAQYLLIHPFNDGNGRISRLLFNYTLAKRGIKHVIPMVESSKTRTLYMEALKRYQRVERQSDPHKRLSTL